MQSRRKFSPTENMREQKQHEMGRYPNSGSRPDAQASGSKVRSPGSRRSMSPRNIERRSGRGMQEDRRIGSLERRDYGWHLGGGRADRVERVRSRSPPYRQLHRRVDFDEVVMHRNHSPPLDTRHRYVLHESMDHNLGDASLTSKNIYGYDHHRLGKEKDFSDERVSVATVGGHGMLGQKMEIEEGELQVSYRLAPEFVPTSQNRETGGNVSSSTRVMDVGRFEHERVQYGEHIPAEKLAVKGVEKATFNSREVSYPMVAASQSNNFGSTSQYKDFGGTSSVISKSDYPVSYQDDVSMPRPNQYIRGNTGKLMGPIGFDVYGQRIILDTTTNPEVNRRNLISHKHDVYSGGYSPGRGEPEEYFYPKSQRTANDDQGYTSHQLYKVMPPHAQLDYDYDQVDYDQLDYDGKGLIRPTSIIPSDVDRFEKTESSHGSLRKGNTINYPSLQNQAVSDYPDMGRALTEQGREYFGSGGSHYEFGRSTSRVHEISHPDVSMDHQVSYLRTDHSFARDADPGFHGQRYLKFSPSSRHDSEMHRVAVRMHKLSKDEIYEPVDRTLERKHGKEENLSRHGSRNVMPSKWNEVGEFQGPYDSDEVWIDEDMSGLYPSRSTGLDYHKYQKAGKYDGGNHQRHIASTDLRSFQHPIRCVQGRKIGSYKHGGRYARGQARSSSLTWYYPHYLDNRSGFRKQYKGSERHDYLEDEHTNDADASEDWANTENSEPSEESEEFKPLVHEAFLKYSKMLNVNASVKRRYKEQGKAGSLFCIVCGRSSSKEFLDTQRLVTHAYMSHKAGLRAEHLGLHKAICVLLGWNCIASPDIITWVPQVLPNTEALAQKEDLILWSPLVVIHNISMSNNNPMVQKVVTIEQVEAFLRAKGFVGGKMKVCLGKPADQSVMLVKFLGTFTGLGIAERLHDYFAEKKHGRVDFEKQLVADIGKSGNYGGAEMQEGEMEELLLYGYMGIAEDLDKVDFDTKKRILIKSKKEIQDLANAPVKPDER